MNLFKNADRMRLFSLLIAIAGLLVVVSSPGLGTRFASSWVRSVGGSAGTQEYWHMASGYTAAFLTAGGICLFVGLYAFLNKK